MISATPVVQLLTDMRGNSANRACIQYTAVEMADWHPAYSDRVQPPCCSSCREDADSRLQFAMTTIINSYLNEYRTAR